MQLNSTSWVLQNLAAVYWRILGNATQVWPLAGHACVIALLAYHMPCQGHACSHVDALPCSCARARMCTLLHICTLHAHKHESAVPTHSTHTGEMRFALLLATLTLLSAADFCSHSQSNACGERFTTRPPPTRTCHSSAWPTYSTSRATQSTQSPSCRWQYRCDMGLCRFRHPTLLPGFHAPRSTVGRRPPFAHGVAAATGCPASRVESPDNGQHPRCHWGAWRRGGLVLLRDNSPVPGLCPGSREAQDYPLSAGAEAR